MHLKLVEGSDVYYYKAGDIKTRFIKVTGTTNALNKLKSELKHVPVKLMGSDSADTRVRYSSYSTV